MAAHAKSTTKPSAADSAAAERGAEAERETAPTVVQHPSLAGDSAAEVAQRTPGATEGTEFRKTFVLLGQFGDDHPVHADNAGRTHEEAIQRGLHPKGTARLVESAEQPECRGKVSTVCTYAVDVVPAAVDTDAASTVSPGRMG